MEADLSTPSKQLSAEPAESLSAAPSESLSAAPSISQASGTLQQPSRSRPQATARGGRHRLATGAGDDNSGDHFHDPWTLTLYKACHRNSLVLVLAGIAIKRFSGASLYIFGPCPISPTAAFPCHILLNSV